MLVLPGTVGSFPRPAGNPQMSGAEHGGWALTHAGEMSGRAGQLAASITVHWGKSPAFPVSRTTGGHVGHPYALTRYANPPVFP